eukprot:5332377-Prymnesium_polylepis.1
MRSAGPRPADPMPRAHLFALRVIPSASGQYGRLAGLYSEFEVRSPIPTYPMAMLTRLTRDCDPCSFLPVPWCVVVCDYSVSFSTSDTRALDVTAGQRAGCSAAAGENGFLGSEGQRLEEGDRQETGEEGDSRSRRVGRRRGDREAVS